MIHPRVLFLGDPAAATPWVGIAKKLARACYDLKIASKLYKLGSGVSIRVENIFPLGGTLAGICKVWIEAGGECEFYLESGLVHYILAGTETIQEDTVSGTLYRADNDAPPFQIEEGEKTKLGAGLKLLPMPLSESDSIAYGLPAVQPEEDPQILIDNKNKLYEKIKTSSYVKPSLFTGKLQLLVQALYGDEMLKFTLGYDPLLLDYPHLDWNAIKLRFNYGDCTGIWTDQETFDYFLVFVKNSGLKTEVKLREIVLNSCGVKLRNYLLKLRQSYEVDTPEWKLIQNQLEGYIIKSVKRLGDEIVLPDMDPLVGLPFSEHGWSFSWWGDQVDIVAHELVDLSGVNNKRVGRHYRITIERIEDYQFSASIDIIETAEYQLRPGRDIIWYYMYLVGLMVAIMPEENPTPFGNAPIYCYRDNEDILRVVRYSYEYEYLVPPSGYDDITTLTVYSDGETTAEDIKDYNFGAVITAGFYCDGVFDGRGISADHSYTHTHTLTCYPEDSPIAPLYNGTNYNSTSENEPPMQSHGYWGDFPPSEVVAGEWMVRNAYFEDIYTQRSNNDTVTEATLIIPEGDLRSVYYGLWEIRPSVTNIYSLSAATRAWEYWFFKNPIVIGQQGLLLGGKMGYVSSFNATNIIYENTAINLYYINMYLSDRKPEDEVIAEIETQDYYGGLGNWVTVFEPSDLDPTLSTIFIVKHSLIDDMIFFTNDDDDIYRNTDNYPYSSQCSYVGWA